MDLIERPLMFVRRKKLIKNSNPTISNDDQFSIIINKIKVSGDYVNIIHDLIHRKKYWNTGMNKCTTL